MLALCFPLRSLGRSFRPRGSSPSSEGLGTVMGCASWASGSSIFRYRWMAFVVFAATYVVAACVYLVVVRLAVDDRRARAFKAFSPGMLPPLGIIFGLLVGFVAMQVWNDFDKAEVAVATEARALRAVVLFAELLPDAQRIHLDT